MTTTNPYDIKAAVDELGQAFHAFREKNDQRLLEIKQHRGSADPVTEETVNRISGALDGMRQKFDSLHVAMQRTALAATGNPLAEQQKSAFNAFVRKGIEPAEQKSMNVSGDYEGGYAVPPVLYDQMITVLRDSSPIRQLATVVTINSDALEMLADRDEAQCAWVAENASRNETLHANLSKIRIPVHEMYAEPRISQKLLDDAVFDVEEWLLAKVAEKMGRTENTAFVSGDGSNRPRGFLSVPLGTGAGQIETVKTGVDGAWAATSSSDALINLQATLKTSYLGEAVWMMNRNLLADIRKFKTTDGQYIWQPGLQPGKPDTLLGYPLYLAEDMPSRSTGSLSVAFGNFRLGYMVVDRAEMRILRDPYTAKPYVKLYTSKRVGGDVTNSEAIKLLQFSV